MDAQKYRHGTPAAAGTLLLAACGIFAVPIGCAVETASTENNASPESNASPEGAEAISAEQTASSSCLTGFNYRYQFFGGLSFVSDPFASNVSVQVDAGGGVMTVDTVQVEERREILLTLVDSVGPIVWSRRYRLPEIDLYGNSLVVSHDEEHVIVTGRAGDDILIMKIEIITGNLVWSKVYSEKDPDPGFSVGKGLLVDRYTDAAGDVGYLVAGTAWQPEERDEHLVLLRIDDGGTLGWGDRYQTSGEGWADVPVALHAEEGTESPLLLGLNHRIGDDEVGVKESTSFAVVDVDGMTGAPGVMSFYPQPEEQARVQFGDFVVSADGDLVATYSVELPEFNIPMVALLPIDANRSPGTQLAYWSTDDVGDHGLAIERVKGGFDIGTYAYRHENDETMDPAGYVPAVLSVREDGTVLAYTHYRDFDFSGLGIAPMMPNFDGYVLKTYDHEFLHLTRTSPGTTGCCDEPIEPDVTKWEVGHEEEEYVRWSWEEQPQDIATEAVEWEEDFCRL